MFTKYAGRRIYPKEIHEGRMDLFEDLDGHQDLA
jgi:hypothetical protein